ncbi:MAG: selenoprotein O, partial [Sphingobium sp.]
AKERYSDDVWSPLRAAMGKFAPTGDLTHPYWQHDAPCSMHIQEVERIWSAIDGDDDWAPLYAKIAAIHEMRGALIGFDT